MTGALTRFSGRVVQAIDVLRGKPPSGREIVYSPQLDSMRDGMFGLTFKRIKGIINNVRSGQIAEAASFFEWMLQQDPRLGSVVNTRVLALTGLDWQVVSASEVQRNVKDKALADEAASRLDEELDRMPRFPIALRRMARAVATNLSVAELVWEKSALIDIDVVPPWRHTMDLQESMETRVLTEEEPTKGIPAVTPKFVVHVPNATSGVPYAESLCMSLMQLWLLRRLAVADWGTFCELFGMPVRFAKYRPGATNEERRMLIDMLKNMGTNAWGAFSEACQIEFLESPQRTQAPYQDLVNWCDRTMAIAVLGGNLLADTTGGTGTHAAASEQQDVRGDLLDADIEAEACTVREQVLRPMATYAYPGREVPIPYFMRIKSDPLDRMQIAQLARQAQGAGADIGAQWFYQAVGIPRPKPGDDLLKPVDAFEEAVVERSGVPGF